MRLWRINPTNCIFYSPEPRAEVYCLRLNINISKLGYWSIRPDRGAYSSFLRMKRLGVFLVSPGWDASPLQGRVTPSSKFAGTHLYTWVKRGTAGETFLAQEHNAMPQPRLEPGSLDPESSALTIGPPRLKLASVEAAGLRFATLTIWEVRFYFHMN